MRAAAADIGLVAIYVIGPDAGPSRIGVSVDPDERLRVARSNCVLDSKLQYEGWTHPELAAERVVESVLKACQRQGLLVPMKRDWLALGAAAAIEAIVTTARLMGLEIMSTAETDAYLKSRVNRGLSRVVPLSAWQDLKDKRPPPRR